MQDPEILRELAEIASRAWAPAHEYDVVGLVEEFSDTMRAELDYLQEARHAERFADSSRATRGSTSPRSSGSARRRGC